MRSIVKQLVVVLACILSGELSLHCQDGVPNIVFQNLVNDFGRVIEGDNLKHIFKFENRGTGLLKIGDVEASCGCTGVLLSAKQIEPGQAGQIEVTLNTAGLEDAGTVLKTVSVSTNDPRQGQVVLSIRAAVVPEFALSSRSIYFGEVPRGKEVTKEITITIAPERESRLLSVTSSDSNVLVRLEPGSSDGKKVKLVAVQKADTKDGYHFGIVSIKTSSNQTPDLKISVRGVVSAPQRN